MMIPLAERKNIMKFTSSYFIRSSMPDALIINEKVRVVYSDTEGAPMNISQMRRRYMAFDIYVKNEEVNTFDSDRLKLRQQLIARRIRYLLTNARKSCNIAFTTIDDFDLGTKTTGYQRYHLVMEYRKTY